MNELKEISYYKNNIAEIENKDKAVIIAFYNDREQLYEDFGDVEEMSKYIENYEIKPISECFVPTEIKDTYAEIGVDVEYYAIYLNSVREAVDLNDNKWTHKILKNEYLNEEFKNIYEYTIAVNITNLRHSFGWYVYDNVGFIEPEYNDYNKFREDVNNLVKGLLIDKIATSDKIKQKDKLKLFVAMQKMAENNKVIKVLLRTIIQNLKS